MASFRNVWFTPLRDIFKYQQALDINDKLKPETKDTSDTNPPPLLSQTYLYTSTNSTVSLDSSSSLISLTLSTASFASNTLDVASASSLTSSTTASTCPTPSKTSKTIVYSINELLQYRKLASSIPKENFKEKEVLWTTYVASPPLLNLPPNIPTYDYELQPSRHQPHVDPPVPSPRTDVSLPCLRAKISSEVLSTDPFKDAVFVALDFENANGIVNAGYGFSGYLKAQMGVCILDTRLISHSSPALQSPETVLKTYNFSTCHSYCDRNIHFIFGETQMTHVKMFSSNLEKLIDRNRNIFLIGHAISNELEVLRALKFDLRTGITGVSDTQAMMQRIFSHPCIRLSDLLQKFRMEFRGLHIAGNDANFTMRAFLLLMNQNAARAPVTDPDVQEKIFLLERIARAKLPTVFQLPLSGPALIVPPRVSLTSRPSRPIPIVPPPGLQFSRPLVPGGSALPLIPIPVASSKPLRPQESPFIQGKAEDAWQATPMQAPTDTRPSIKSITSLSEEPVTAGEMKSL